ncbi:hypothetical protein MDOR_11120 [Mycolicibacterium doricum]|uniref:Resolvase/invertase-type recombinase catalytic domain-containing protein n=3 Tax=Mycolicibacterium doricum TaxID=126673 RepID=A0A7I7VS01_9MYCO|nr:recombinase family protein [Mycolicibacterium doricum]BBZ06943.1 hypothetical protein MDOR_11120 [Mycolicibacterium doricum]
MSPTNDPMDVTKAVLYLRVSSKKQMDTAVDIDPDGNSIATQREVSTRKANDLGADVVREFVEPGVSASTIEKRQAFQDMLTFLRENPCATSSSTPAHAPSATTSTPPSPNGSSTS